MNQPADDFRGESEPGSTSSSLPERAKAGDDKAWRRLTDLYTPLVYNAFRRARLQASDAADVMQEVFTSVAVGLKDFRKDRPGDSFRGWLWKITKHKLVDHFRRQDNEPPAEGGSDAHEQLEQIAAEFREAAEFSLDRSS